MRRIKLEITKEHPIIGSETTIDTFDSGEYNIYELNIDTLENDQNSSKSYGKWNKRY